MPNTICSTTVLNPAADTVEYVTEVQRQEALLKTGNLQSAIFNSANFSMIATDEKGIIQLTNSPSAPETAGKPSFPTMRPLFMIGTENYRAYSPPPVT